MVESWSGCYRLRLGSYRTGYPEWENGIPAFGLRLEGVCVECGRIILNIQFMQPIQLVQHEARSKSYSTPVTEIAVNSRGSPEKLPPGCKKSTVVLKIVDSH